jgi:imidazoleglycerol-phosphate dehydratase
LCGRANLIYNCNLLQGRIGDFDTESIKEFFKALTSNSFITLHINLLYGENLHHNCECIFKAVAKALKEAASKENAIGISSTKGCI